MIEVILATFVGGAVGFVVRGLFGAKAVNEVIAEDWSTELQLAEAWEGSDMRADKLGVLQGRIDLALKQVTAGANSTVKRMARILRGEA